MYKLNKLSIYSFVGIEKASIEFNKPVTLFVGTNNQGKSTVKDALCFAFTGKARGVGIYKDVKCLAHNGGDIALGVVLEYLIDGERARIQRDVETASGGVQYNPLIPYCIEPASFISLPAKERGAVLSAALGGGLDNIVERAIGEHIDPINPTVIAAINKTGIDMHDVDLLRNTVVELRRHYKRQSEQEYIEPVITDYELPAGFNSKATAKRKDELDKQISKGRGTIKKAAELKYQKQDLQETLDDIGKLEKQVKPVPAVAGIDANTLNDLCDTTGLLQRIVDKGKNSKCPLCTLGQLTIEQWREMLADRQRRLKKYTKAIAEKQKVESNNLQLQARIGGLKERAAELQALVDKGEGKGLPKNVERQLKKLDEQRLEVAGQLDRFLIFTSDKKHYEKELKAKGGYAALIDECNRIDEALKDGGPVKAAIAAGGRSLPINENLVVDWGLNDLDWKDNGVITLNGRPIELASKSEKYRAAAVMGLALAEVGGIGFTAFDEFEMLDSNNANYFFDNITDSGVNNVLVFATSDKQFDKVPSWMDVYRVSEGRVQRV